MRGIVSGSKVTITLPNGLRWPGVAVSDEVETKAFVQPRKNGEIVAGAQPVEITVTRFDVITKRERRDGEVYLSLTNEVGEYGYRPKAEFRDSTVPGLDATDDGEVITLQGLRDLHGVSYSAWQAAQFEARNGATDAASL